MAPLRPGASVRALGPRRPTSAHGARVERLRRRLGARPRARPARRLRVPSSPDAPAPGRVHSSAEGRVASGVGRLRRREGGAGEGARREYYSRSRGEDFRRGGMGRRRRRMERRRGRRARGGAAGGRPRPHVAPRRRRGRREGRREGRRLRRGAEGRRRERRRGRRRRRLFPLLPRSPSNSVSGFETASDDGDDEGLAATADDAPPRASFATTPTASRYSARRRRVRFAFQSRSSPR